MLFWGSVAPSGRAEGTRGRATCPSDLRVDATVDEGNVRLPIGGQGGWEQLGFFVSDVQRHVTSPYVDELLHVVIERSLRVALVRGGESGGKSGGKSGYSRGAPFRPDDALKAGAN
jgi:hypothetical protein